MNKYISLDKLKPREAATVTSLDASCSMKGRFEDLGITPGTEIRCVMVSPLGDPTAYLVRGALIAIRREDAKGIGIRYGTYL